MSDFVACVAFFAGPITPSVVSKMYAFPNIPMATGMRESLVIEQYVSGLGNPDWKLKRHAQFAHPSTLDRAISIAVEFEAFEESQMYNTDDILEITIDNVYVHALIREPV
jgi:hypothetical protein